MTQGETFRFTTASFLTRICNQRATSLRELERGLQECSDNSIFYHTFQSLGRYHFLTEGFSNDFAQWVLAACNQPRLAEQLASLDIRDYLALDALRGDLGKLVSAYCREQEYASQQPAFEPFYFLESVQVEAPLDFQARTLREFRDGVARLSHAAFHFHFITSRLRLHLRTNDFSYWLENSLGLETLAKSINRIDIYTKTVQGVQERMLQMLDGEMHA
ncbi:MAG: DUF5752 family protein [Candidatus Acidiferrales bacterium]